MPAGIFAGQCERLNEIDKLYGLDFRPDFFLNMRTQARGHYRICKEKRGPKAAKEPRREEVREVMPS